MKRLERVAVWLATATCLLFFASLRDARLATEPARPAAAAEAGGVASLIVRLVRAGAPADGATVRVLRVDGEGNEALATESASGVASTDGEVRFDELAAGSHWVLAECKGSARHSRKVELVPGERTIELALEAAAPLEVVVVDGSQRPIENARVVASGGDPLDVLAHSDVTGLAVFEDGPPAPWALEVTAKGFGRKLLEHVEPKDSPLFVKLERASALVVRVRDEAGVPKSDAVVTVAGSALWPARTATTDASGTVSIAELPRGFYEARAEAGELVSEPGAGVLLEQGEHEELELQLVKGRFVRVFVTDGEGDPPIPLESADVVLSEGGLSSFPRFGRTSDRGEVSLGPLTDDASVSASANGFVPKSAVPVEEGASEVRVSLVRGGELSGRVVDERGFGIEGVTLEVIGVDRDGMPLHESTRLSSFRREHFAASLAGPGALVATGELGVTHHVPNIPLAGMADLGHAELGGAELGGAWTTRPDGTFLLTPVTPGRVELVARHPGFAEGTSRPVELAPGRRARIELVLGRGGTLEGRVVEANGFAAVGARIELVPQTGGFERVTYAADDGRFGFAAAPREVLITVARAAAPEHVVIRVELSIEPDTRHELELVLPEERQAVALRVVDDRGFSLDRGELHVTSLDPASALTRTLFSDDAGETRLEGGRGLALRITARRSGHAPAAIELEHAPAEVTIALDAAVVGEGEVRAGGRALAGAAVTLLTATGERRTRSDERGAFSFPDLARGNAQLMVAADGHAFVERAVAIEPRRDRADFGTIELSRGATVEGEVLDELGEPVVGARVAIGRVPTFLPLGKLPPGVAQTDPRGRFVLRDVEPGEASIEAFKWEHGRASLGGLTLRSDGTVRDVRIVLARDPEAAVYSGEATLAVSLAEEGGGVTLAHVPYGGEAMRAGILAGDRLYAVDGRPVRALEEARHALDGPLSQELVLELGRAPDLHWRVRARRERLRR